MLLRCASSRWRARRLPFMCGSPSVSLCSRLTSSSDIFSRLACRNFCSGTSIIANSNTTTSSSVTPVEHPAAQLAQRALQRHQHQRGKRRHMRANELPGHHADHRGDAGQLGGVDQLLFGEQPPDALERAEPGEVGHRAVCCSAPSRPRPRWPPGQSPAPPAPAAARAACPAPTAADEASPAACSGCCRVLWSKRRCERSAMRRLSKPMGSSATITSAPPPSTARLDRSLELGTWPSLRAFFRRCGVAGRFLS